MKVTKQNKFWDSFARKYDPFIERYAKNTYEQSIRLLKKELYRNSKVLEIGTGTGLIAFAIAEQVKEIIAIDNSSEMINVAIEKQIQSNSKNIVFQVSDANKINNPDKSFDIIVASNVFHLIPNAEEVLWEIRRILKDDGKVILPTYCHGQNIKARIISAFMGLSGFKAVNRWSTSQFRSFVENEGFVIQKEEIISDRIPLSFIVSTKSNNNHGQE
jgi:ubiquinone/menaquinone biosynthesis C-methylase UbiE